MGIRKYQLNIIYILSLLPSSAICQEWSVQDSLKLQQMLKSDLEIRINKGAVEKAEQNIYHPKSYVKFEPTLLTLKLTNNIPKQYVNSYILFQQPTSSFLHTYSWLRINKNLILQSKSNYAENQNYFHILTQMEFKLSKQWSISMHGTQNLDSRRYRGLLTEVTPTYFNSNIIFKVNKHLKIKTGIQYQYNVIRRKWEWIPQSSIAYEW